MILYWFQVAPNPTKVRLYLAEKRAEGGAIDLLEQQVDLTRGEQKTEAHRARNPFGRLPVLELDDGSFLTESLAIVEFLEEIHPEPPLLGRDPVERARVRDLERIADMGVLLPIARIVHATRSPLGWPPVPAVAEDARPALQRACEVLDGVLADGRPFLAGERPTIADCTLAAGLQFGRFGRIALDPALGHLARWDESYRMRAPVRSVLTL